MGIPGDIPPLERARIYILEEKRFLLRQVLPKIPQGADTEKLIKAALRTRQPDIAELFFVRRACPADKKLVEIAIAEKQWRIAEMFFRAGFDVNYAGEGDAPLIWAVAGHEARLFLIRHGAHVPVWFLSYPAIREYIERPWTPGNHRDWPYVLLAQIRTILVVARGPRRSILSSVANDLLLYLIAAVAKEHIVIVPE